MKSTLETLKDTLACPDYSRRPVQIIHCHYPKTPEGVAAYLDTAAENGLGGFVVNVDYVPEKQEGESRESFRQRRLEGYLGTGTPETEEAWDKLKYFVDACFERGFKVWIYDELAYPSGAAGNKVLAADPDYQVKGLVCATAVTEGGQGEMEGDRGRLLEAGAYQILKDGRLDTGKVYPVIVQEGRIVYDLPEGASYRVCAFYAKPLAFLTENEVPYTDLMRADVVDQFIKVTYEEYRKHLGEETIGKLTAFFTDEPGLPTHGCSRFFEEKGAVAAWTEELEQLVPDLASRYVDLFFDTDRDFAKVRREYWKQVARLFGENYFGRIAAWCEKYGTRMTGHLYGEETLGMQIGLNGDLFGLMRYMQMPGVDRLYCTEPRDVTAEKSATSAAHLYGRPYTMSENSFHLEYNFWNMREQATAASRLNSTFYQMQLGLSHVSSYFGYSGEFDAERLAFEEQAARASTFCGTGVHQADVLVLIPMTAAYERYTPQDHKYWDVGPCIVGNYQGDSIKTLEKAYGEVLRRLEDARLDCDLIDAIGLGESRVQVEGAELTTPYERFKHLVIFDSGYFEEEIQLKIAAFLEKGGTVTAVRTDLPTEFCSRLAAQYPKQFIYAAYEQVCEAVLEGNAEPVLNLTAGPNVRVRKSETEDAQLWFVHNRGESCRITVNETGRFHVMTPAWENSGEEILSEGSFVLEMGAGEAKMLVREKACV